MMANASGSSQQMDLIESDAVVAQDLRKVFRIRLAAGGSRDLVAVDGVSFDVPAGGSLALVGESGSGKSTVARMVAGLERPTSGEIAISGKARTKVARSRAARKERGRQVQMVYQDPYASLDPRQTVGDGLDEVLRFHFSLTANDLDARRNMLLEQVGLDKKHAEGRPSSLSGGQRQRVAIARALACEPELLVLDEAVSGLDVSVQGQVLNLLADLRSQLHVSYLFISHDLAVVQQVSDTVIVMRNGRVVEDGATDDVLRAPQNEYTQQLLSAVPRSGWKPRRRNSVAASD